MMLSMDILEITEEVRKAAKAYGHYRLVAAKSGVGYEWLAKFSSGAIPNPTVANVARIEAFFKDHAANDGQQDDQHCS